MSSVKLAVPKERLNHAVVALGEFRAWAKILLKDAEFSGPSEVYWAADRQQSMLVMYAAPAGEPIGSGIEYSVIAEAIKRTVAIRSRRRVLETCEMREPKPGWWREIQKAYAPLFERSARGVGDGWVDLTLALADWLWQIDIDTLRIDEYVCRDAALDIDAQGYDDQTFGILGAFEMLSSHVCDECGAPGKTYVREPLPAITKCQKHKLEEDE